MDDNNDDDPILQAIMQGRDPLQGHQVSKDGIVSESRSGQGLSRTSFGRITVHDTGEGLTRVNKDVGKSQLKFQNELSKKEK
jgi:hypothetical protein